MQPRAPRTFLIRMLLVLTSLGAGSSAAADPPEPVFRAQEIDAAVEIGYGIAIADVDGDGRSDVLLADKSTIQWYENPTWRKHVIAAGLTPRDNVCIAAHDIDGDGRCEIAVGAQWNPGETTDDTQSGAVFYLVAPDDRRGRWEPVRLHHEPTVHRMHWVLAPDGVWELVVKPLHGRGNKDNSGAGSRVFAYRMPAEPRDPWTLGLVSDFTHASHNFHPINWDDDAEHELVTGAKEGLFWFGRSSGSWRHRRLSEHWTGEVRDGRLPDGSRFLATIEPMHGNVAAVLTEPDHPGAAWNRRVLDTSLVDGHAVAVADFLGTGSDQIAVGWRAMNPRGVPGARLFTPLDVGGAEWRATDLSGPEVAIEDMKAADLNGDGRPELILAGRATKNLRILWNETTLKR
jgi:hypothetical protein